MRRVRWIVQVAKPGSGVWQDRNELVYAGWFHSTGDETPNPTVVAAYERAVKELHWLDVRLVQETRSLQHQVLEETLREVEVTE